MRGRPTKLTSKFLRTVKKVLENENIALLTDEDLLFQINDRLLEKERIDQRTFRRWKTKIVADEEDNEDKNVANFVLLIKRALIEQEVNLLNALRNNPKGWQRFAWMLERKFDEWNMRKIIAKERREQKQTQPATLTFLNEEV